MIKTIFLILIFSLSTFASQLVVVAELSDAYSFQFDLHYNGLTPSRRPCSTNIYPFVFCNEIPGALHVAAFGLYSVSGHTELLRVRFNEEGPVEFTNVYFNEDAGKVEGIWE